MFKHIHRSLYFIILSALLLESASLFAQPRFRQNPMRVPVYRSMEDSITLHNVESEIRKLSNTATSAVARPKVDSLYSLYKKLSDEAILGFRMVYFPGNDFIVLDSLYKISDLLAVKKVSLYNYHATDLPEIIYECKNLEALELINSRIRVLPESLNSFSKLTQVVIYNHSAPRLKLKKNNNITELIISGSIPGALPRSFRSLHALRKLDLSGNGLTKFPNGSRRNRHLRELALQNNKLTLNRRLKRHPYVETLGLQRNAIEQVPSSIRRFSNLRKLSFNHNLISHVHRRIADLERLENLSFYSNKLGAIPDGLYALVALRELDLFYNQLEEIGIRVRDWKNLTSLYLSHNRIVTVPDQIAELPVLEGLYIWDNRISELPEALGKIKTLRFLWVNDNNLTGLPSSLFALDKIEELDLSHNFLTTIPEDVFNFKQIKILSLADNPWDKQTMLFITKRAAELRSRNVFIHIPVE